MLGFCGYDFGARNLAGGLKAGRGFIRPKPLSDAEVARIDEQAGALPSVPHAEYGVPAGAAEAAREMLAEQARRSAAVGAERADGAESESEARADGAAEPPLSAPAAPRAPPVALELTFGLHDVVRVLKGPFRNLEGPVLDIAPADGSAQRAVTVELLLMGQRTAVQVDARALASVLE